MDDETWEVFYDRVHDLGLDHLQTLADAAASLRSAMADCSREESLHIVQHLCEVSRTMLGWSHYLIPKAPRQVPMCAACAAADDEDDEDAC